MKLKCARKALEMIKDGMTVGLGGGSTVALLINEIETQGRKIQAVTPSRDTMELCVRHHIPVQPLEWTDALDLAFDGCDELDAQLNALKSCGGIHTREKIAASMAKEYILLADESKWKERLQFSYPIAVEVLRPAAAFVERRLREMGADVTWRSSNGKAGRLVSDDGNYLLDAQFHRADGTGRVENTDGAAGIAGRSRAKDIGHADSICRTADMDAGRNLESMTGIKEYRLHADRPAVTMSMAGMGVISRLCGEVFGSALTFGAAGRASAPGQMDVQDLAQVLFLLHKSL